MIHFYFLSLLAFGFVNIAELSFASPAGERLDLHKRVAPEFCSSGGLSRLASRLSANSATSFCSEYLGIETATISQTETSQTFTIATTTIDVFISTTETVVTETIALTVTTTDATRPTTVATSTSIINLASTVTTYPFTVTFITSTWYTSSTVKKRGIPIIETTASVPAYLVGFAPPAISSGCSCLDIPTPSISVTETTYVPSTISTVVIRTVTNTINATLTVSTTSTLAVTSYVPATLITAATSLSIQTVSATTTVTVTRSFAYRPQCTAILSGQKLYNGVQPLRQYTYPFSTTPIQNSLGGEDTFSQCCEQCYAVPDCAQFYAYAATLSTWRCQIIFSTTSVTTRISPLCPKGVVPSEGVSGRTGTFTPGLSRGIGPCYGYAGVPI
ncbi:hypothetical protein TWF506_009398 [Arthrobotrys conoides]|uniref:Apple domain-containing protein n=1 Tax=Arthrobotrys conoides TaxID=74498 RepID=A0AAN8RRI8_9PEZI